MNIVLHYFRRSIFGPPPQDIDDLYCPRFAAELDCYEMVTIYSWKWLQEELARNTALSQIMTKVKHHYHGREAYLYLLSQVNPPGIESDSTDTIRRYGKSPS